MYRIPLIAAMFVLMSGLGGWQLSVHEGDGNKDILAQQGSGDEGNTDGTNKDYDDGVFPGGDETNDGATTNDTLHRNRDDRLVTVGNTVSEFGGMYFHPGEDVLNVYMLDTEDSDQAAAIEQVIRDVFPNAIRSGGIRIVQGTYSIVQLKSWYDELRERISKSELTNGEMHMTDLAEHENGIAIGMSNEELFTIVEGFAEEIGIPSGVVDLRVSRPIRWNKTTEDDDPTSTNPSEDPPSNGTIRDRIRPVIGGVQTRGQDKGYCTQAFNAIRSSVEGVVVNDHCTGSFPSMSSTNFYQPVESSSNKIGRETVG